MTFEPLKGVRILDLTSVVIGPVATSRLAQYGAEIVKIENPSGDLMRGLGGASPTGEHSGAYLHFNRNKQNICLNLKAPGAKEIMDRLIESASVIVANMRPQALERLGWGPSNIRSKAPDKIYCLLTGYGTDGPYAGLPTYDSVVQGAAGIAGLSLARDGTPSYVPLLICDHVVGEIAAGAILAAIAERQRTGVGALVEVPMFETMAAFVLQEHLAQQSFLPPVGPAGDQRLLNPNNRPVLTRDGYISLTINTDEQVRNFLHTTDRKDLIDDPRFSTVAARAKHVETWFAIRGAPLTSKTTAEWLVMFRDADIPAMPCHTLETLATDPHLQAVQLLSYEDHPAEGRIVAIRPTILVNGTRASAGQPAVPRGWDTHQILSEIGFCPTEIEELYKQGAAISYKNAREA
ncbi:CoA transferase [Mesorhizobium sp. YR577]|uniref:CaiB/BaiF CoA transferase family protein n=1 Tax=Mesorhizobium sp. YR577 TaxID=1884373 RepID=UPI0008E9FF8B|nr:CoA transferase [Mesorhizobium sp. YR577]SFU21983.1 Crotonobetainyl-CoA:carnitine CoA-transferase CaiB [Mesorhizobium sp. YR577]